MRKDVALRLLCDIMNWDGEMASEEFAWLRLMSRLKYDSYRGFVAGVRFVESLAGWLQQFDGADRHVAYEMVRNRLLYLDPAATQHLVDLAFPETIRSQLVEDAASQMQIRPYQLWASDEGRQRFGALLQRTLFLGLSDGARIDQFRRANVGIISNEQVAVGTELDDTKWDSFLQELAQRTGDGAAKFSCVYLIDDFMGSGSTFLRNVPGTKEWKGKLVKFWNQLQGRRESHFTASFTVRVHHYLTSAQAKENTERNAAKIMQDRGEQWFEDVQFSFGMVLPDSVRITRERDPELVAVLDRYYDDSIETTHTKVGGHKKLHLGYGECGLPLVLEHNTPNNSIALLWAESEPSLNAESTLPHAMRPLFRRRQRHE